MNDNKLAKLARGEPYRLRIPPEAIRTTYESPAMCDTTKCDQLCGHSVASPVKLAVRDGAESNCPETVLHLNVSAGRTRTLE